MHAAEADPDEQKRHGQSEGVDREQDRAAPDRARVRCEKQDRGEDRPDAGGRADRERPAEESPRAASAGGLEQARRGESIEERQRQQAHEREPHDDDHETGHLPHEAWVVDEAHRRRR